MTLKNDLDDFKQRIIDKYIIESDENEIKSVFDTLTKNCIRAYINDENTAYEYYFYLIQDLMLSFSSNFTNIFDYVNYCFLKNMNDIFEEIIPRDFKLGILHNSNLKLSPEDESK